MARPRLIFWLATLAGIFPADYLYSQTNEAQAIAEAALVNTFTLQGVTAVQPLRPGNQSPRAYDWDWRGPRDDPEWAWFFNRHGWFPALAEAYSLTGDTRYRDALLDTLDDWIVTHPAPKFITFSSAWRPLEAARRLQKSWLPIVPYLKQWPEFTPERRARFETSLVTHGNHLRRWHAFGGNHLITEMVVLVRLALERPDLPGANDWLDYALARLERAYTDQIYPDGAHVELSTHYQRVIALSFQELLDLLRRYDRQDLVDRWTPRLERLWRYVATVMTPAGGNPINNDSDREDYRGLLRIHAPELLAIPPTTTHFAWAGQTVFHGDGCIPTWAFFEAGPRGTDHDHADHLQFTLSLGEAAFLIDPGRYSYQPGPWREYFVGPTGHNIVLLDGRGSEPQPRKVKSPPVRARFERLDRLELAWGRATFTTPFNARRGDWLRLVVHAPGEGWIVADQVVVFGPAEITTQWLWGPEVNIPRLPTAIAPELRAWVGNIGLLLEGPQTGRWTLHQGQAPPLPVRGWSSTFFNQRTASPQTLFHQKIRQPTVNLWFFRPESNALIRLCARMIDSTRLELQHGDAIYVLDLNTLP